VAQRITLSPAPTMAPSKLTGHGFLFSQPLHAPWVAVIEAVVRMARAAAAQLRRPSAEGAELLALEVGGAVQIEVVSVLRLCLN